MILVAGWLTLGFLNFLKWVFNDPPQSFKEILADLFLILPMNLVFGAVVLITSILK